MKRFNLTESNTDARATVRELSTHLCPGCGLPVVGWTASRAHCALPTDDDAAEWQEYERRRHEEPR